MKIKNKKWKNLLLASALALGALLIFDIIPGYADVFSLSLRLLEQKSLIKDNPDIESSINALTGENRGLKKTLNRITYTGESSGKFGLLLTELEQAAKQNKASIKSLKPLKSYDENKLIVQPVELKLNAEYEGIYNFLRYLENSQNVFVIKEAKFINTGKNDERPEAVLIMDFYLNL